MNVADKSKLTMQVTQSGIVDLVRENNTNLKEAYKAEKDLSLDETAVARSKKSCCSLGCLKGRRSRSSPRPLNLRSDEQAS
jgi:hypothetical protein